MPLDVLAQPDHQRAVVTAGGRRGENVCQPDHFTVGVRHFDAHSGLAGDRREDADTFGGHRVGDIALQRSDFLDLDAGAEFDLVARYRRAPGAAGHRGVDLELLQDR